MKRIALLLLLASAAFGQNRNPRPVQTMAVPAGHVVESRMIVSCVVQSSAVVRVPFITLNTADLQASFRPPQTSAHPQTYWVPMMPNQRMADLSSLVTVNNKTARQSDDIPFTATTEKDDKYIYVDITF
jgi:hypothetical protein